MNATDQHSARIDAAFDTYKANMAKAIDRYAQEQRQAIDRAFRPLIWGSLAVAALCVVGLLVVRMF